jgi:hypothetical protein
MSRRTQLRRAGGEPAAPPPPPPRCAARAHLAPRRAQAEVRPRVCDEEARAAAGRPPRGMMVFWVERIRAVAGGHDVGRAQGAVGVVGHVEVLEVESGGGGGVGARGGGAGWGGGGAAAAAGLGRREARRAPRRRGAPGASPPAAHPVRNHAASLHLAVHDAVIAPRRCHAAPAQARRAPRARRRGGDAAARCARERAGGPRPPRYARLPKPGAPQLRSALGLPDYRRAARAPRRAGDTPEWAWSGAAGAGSRVKRRGKGTLNTGFCLSAARAGRAPPASPRADGARARRTPHAIALGIVGAAAASKTHYHVQAC